jgi:glycosyltransferase involved in cell wall biosynthesis
MSVARPRLCIVTPVHWKAFMGGAQYQIKCLLECLRSLDRYDVHYLARRVPEERQLDGYTIWRIGDGAAVSRFGYSMDARKLYCALRNLRPDVIYQRIGCAYTGVSAYYARRNGARLVWHASSDADLDRGVRPAERNFVRGYLETTLLSYGIRHADRVVVQTNSQARLLQDNYSRSADAVVANFHPSPNEARTPADPLRIVWIANFKRLKQPEVFVRLAKSLRDVAQVRFVMIGAPVSGSGEVKWSEDLMRGIASVPNLSHLGQDEVNTCLAGAYLFINTSLYEGFPNTFIQAWLRGIPVVSLNVNPDGILDRESVGIYAGTEQRLIESVRDLVENRVLRDRLASRASAYAREYHSMNNAQKVVQMIDSVAPCDGA